MSSSFIVSYAYFTNWSDLLSLQTKFQNVTMQMKATEQCFPVVLFISPYKVVLTFASVNEMLCCNHSIEC